MSTESRREYIRTQRGRYRSATRAQKGQILDEGRGRLARFAYKLTSFTFTV